MNNMDIGKGSGTYKVTEEEVLAATHGLAILLYHYDGTGEKPTITEIARKDIFYSQRDGSLLMCLLAGCGMYAANAFRKLLGRHYGEGAEAQYMPEVQRIIQYLTKQCEGV